MVKTVPSEGGSGLCPALNRRLYLPGRERSRLSTVSETCYLLSDALSDGRFSPCATHFWAKTVVVHGLDLILTNR
jgi:hypothetical protein